MISALVVNYYQNPKKIKSLNQHTHCSTIQNTHSQDIKANDRRHRKKLTSAAE